MTASVKKGTKRSSKGKTVTLRTVPLTNPKRSTGSPDTMKPKLTTHNLPPAKIVPEGEEYDDTDEDPEF